MSYQNKRNSANRSSRDYTPRLDTSQFILKPKTGEALNPELFNSIAHELAKVIAQGKSNKYTQIRKFYDELVMWEERAQQPEKNFDELLPFIRMMNAKAAYAKGRGHIDENFVILVNKCLEQVDDPVTLRNFKLFFEAFLGFYKLEAH